ncbi:hypothetical protein [Dactylosporangium sp. NPDC048998]|uniref:hypothetical protein n=1 Tax=Dactylosporangium sp. NPDC048998 TaxID=3363976 RepID=UPI0037153360
MLFQRRVGSQRRPFGRHAIRQLLHEAIAGLGAVDADGAPLTLTPHDFRRMFVTEAIASGLRPPRRAFGQLEYPTPPEAVYPADAINAHRAFLARRRSVRPAEEYRTPTEQEWTDFLGHFELRKVALGTCGRVYASPCTHEHACAARCFGPILHNATGSPTSAPT